MLIIPQPILYVPAGGGGADTDDFNRSNENLTVSSDWTAVDGDATDAQVSSNQLVVQAGAGGYSAAYATAPSSDNYYIQWNFVSATNSSGENRVGFAGRASGGVFTGDGYWVRWDSAASSLLVVEKSSGSDTTIITGSSTPADGDLIRLEMDGTSIELFVDGSSVGSATDSTHTTGDTRLWVYQDAAGDIQTLDNFEQGTL